MTLIEKVKENWEWLLAKLLRRMPPKPPKVKYDGEPRMTDCCVSAINEWGESALTYKEQFEYVKSSNFIWWSRLTIFSKGATGYRIYIKQIGENTYRYEKTIPATTEINLP